MLFQRNCYKIPQLKTACKKRSPLSQALCKELHNSVYSALLGACFSGAVHEAIRLHLPSSLRQALFLKFCLQTRRSCLTQCYNLRLPTHRLALLPSINSNASSLLSSRPLSAAHPPTRRIDNPMDNLLTSRFSTLDHGPQPQHRFQGRVLGTHWQAYRRSAGSNMRLVNRLHQTVSNVGQGVPSLIAVSSPSSISVQ